jgi:trigger factor
LNIQTERLADHTARVMVELEEERLNQAKQKAAKRISTQVNVPGFRKGKAPYRILVNFVGEQAILDDAVELLSNDVYKEVLAESQLDPYGPGALENFNADPTPTLTFLVPLQPEVSLGDYRSIRLDYAKPVIDDEAVNRAMKSLQEQQAVVEDSHQPVAPGNRVTMDIHSGFVDKEENAEGSEETSTENAEALSEASNEPASETQPEGETPDASSWQADTHEHEHGQDENVFLHEHDTALILDADHELMPGFSDALAGATVGERRTFELVAPENNEEFTDIAGKTVKFDTVVKKIETMTLPALNDDFAARLTTEEEKPLSLLELRMRVRQNLETVSQERYDNDYSNRVLSAVVEGAQIAFPEAMLVDEVEQFMQQMDQSLRQQGLTLNDYMKIYHKTIEDLYTEYRPAAEQRLRRSLAMRQLIEDEHIAVTDDEINAEIDRVVGRFDDNRQTSVRKLFSDRAMRDNVVNDLLRARVQERMVAIAKGEAPEITETGDNEISEEAQEEGESA